MVGKHINPSSNLLFFSVLLFPTLDFLGSAKLSVKDLFRDGDSPWTKRLLLEDVKNGEIELKIELILNKSDLLL